MPIDVVSCIIPKSTYTEVYAYYYCGRIDIIDLKASRCYILYTLLLI